MTAKERNKLTLESLQKFGSQKAFEKYQFRILRTNVLDRDPDKFEYFIPLGYEDQTHYFVFFPSRKYVCESHSQVSYILKPETKQGIAYGYTGLYGRELTEDECMEIMSWLHPEEKERPEYKLLIQQIRQAKVSETPAAQTKEKPAPTPAEVPATAKPKTAQIISDSKYDALCRALKAEGFVWNFVQDDELKCVLGRSRRQLERKFERMCKEKFKRTLGGTPNGETISLS